MTKNLVILPAHNEAAALPALLDEIRTVLPDWEVLVIDDGSLDSSAETARRHGAEVAVLPFNLGIGGAVQTGYQHAVRRGHGIVLRMDGDGQHRAADALRMLQVLERDEADIVIGSRFLDDEVDTHQPAGTRRLGIRIFRRLVTLITRVDLTDPTSGMRMVNSKVAEYSARHHPEDFPEIESLVQYHRHGFRIAEVPVSMREREHGESTIRGPRAVYYGLRVLWGLLVLTFRKD